MGKPNKANSGGCIRSKRLAFQSLWLLILLGCYLATESDYFFNNDDDDDAALEALMGSSASWMSLLQQIQGNETSQRKMEQPVKIAYAISITHCPPPKKEHSDWVKVVDGPAVLAHSIHRNTLHGNNLQAGVLSHYDYQLYAFVHPDARSCTQHLPQLNYTVLIYDTPFNVSEIKKETYRNRVQQESAGCCKEKEFLKLYSYMLDQHPLVVHLDADTLILRPLDELYEVLLTDTESDNNAHYLGSHAQWPSQRVVNGRIHSLFTRDYPMGNVKTFQTEHFGMQGGFWIVRPNKTAFDEMVHLILEGNFSLGWYDGMVHYKGFYGAAMIQGLVGFFYSHIHPGQAVELNRCLYNNMADNPWDEREGICRIPTAPGGPSECPDCRHTKQSEIYSTHFTLCGKPWWCKKHNAQDRNSSLCRSLTRQWFSVRRDLESRGREAEPATEDDPFLGYCVRTKNGRRYQMMNFSSVQERV